MNSPFTIGTTIFAFCVSLTTADTSESLIVKRLTWQYTALNENCTDGSEGRNPCQDIRICNFAEASIMIGGKPTLCGYVGKGVSKVCCGLPLVLGETLMKKIDAERAKTRACGTTAYGNAVSPTENLFFQVLRSLPPVDTRDPEKFDPHLDLKIEPMISSQHIHSTIEGKFPWMVAIFKGSTNLCGGVLIDRKHVLVGAHCFFDSSGWKSDTQKYTARIGSIYTNKGVPFKISKIVVHEQYSSKTYSNDIALVVLEKEIMEPMVAHICLPDALLASVNFTGLNVTPLEWRREGDSKTVVLHELKSTPVISNSHCRKMYQRIATISPSVICAGTDEQNGNSSCQKSYGAALKYKNNIENLQHYHPNIPWVLVGIPSFGMSCGRGGQPTVYTRVSDYMDWIAENSAHP